MSLKRLVIPLRDVKFMLDDEVSTLFSKMQPNAEDSKIKDNEEPQTNRGARNSKRSAKKPKYNIESDGSSFDEGTKNNNKKIKFDKGSESDDDAKNIQDTEELQEKKGGRISRRSSGKSKHVNTNEDISSDDDDITIIGSVESPKKRGGRKSIRSVGNSKCRKSDETQAKRYGRRSKRSSGKPNYKEAKQDSTTDEDSKIIKEAKQDSTTDEDSNIIQDNEESQAKRNEGMPKRSAGKPKYKESKEDNITDDENSNVTQDNEESQAKRNERMPKRSAGKPKDEESKEANATDEGSKEESKEDNATDEGSKDSDEELKSAKDATRSTQRKKYKKVEFEDSETDGCTKNSENKFDEGNESDGNRKKIKKIKFDESSESDESEFRGNRKKTKKINVDDDSESGDTKNIDNNKELKSARNETSSIRKKYSRIKLDEESASDGEAKHNDNKKVQATRIGKRSKRSAENPECKESNEDSASDEDIKDDKKFKQTSARPKRGDSMDEYESEEGTTSTDDTNSKENITEEELSFNEETTTTEESSSQYSTDESSSSSEKSDTPQKKRKESSAQKRTKGPLSEYEKRIEEKRSEKMKFLESIKIDEIKEELKEVVKKVKKKKTKSERHTSDEELSEPLRRSNRNVIVSEPRSKRRVREKEFNYSEDALYEKVVEEALTQKEEEEKETMKRVKKLRNINRELLPVEMSFEEALELDDFYKYYVVDIKVQESKSESKCIYDKSVLEKLGLNPPRDGSFKLETTDRAAQTAITAFAWYPSSENLVLAAGCHIGTLSFWNVNTGTDPYIFKNHLLNITHLQFNPFNHNQIISSSLDGTMRSGDMVKKVFNELYASTEYTCCQYFDFLSDSSYIVAKSKGLVAIVDHRTDGKRSEKEFLCHDFIVKTVNVHPVNKSYFVTANTDGCVRLWDLRKMQEHPIAHIQRREHGAQFAFFSPVTGNSILASTKSCFSLYDSTNLTENICLRKEKMQKQYINLRGPIKAMWLPNSEEAFYISSNGDPQGIIVYDTKLNIFHKMAHEAFTTVYTPMSLFHPCRPAVAVGKRHWGFVFS